MNSKSTDHTHLLNFANGIIKEGNSLKVRAGGNSMYPHIKKGSLLTIKKVDMSLLKKGDVVVFSGDNKFVAHRILKVASSQQVLLITTKGDSCKRKDAVFGVEKYIGKVIFVENNGKITDMESPFRKSANAFLAFISPYTPVVYNIIRFFKHLFRKNKTTKS